MLDPNDSEKLAKLGTKSALRARIDLMCKSCIYDRAEKGGWRQQIGACDMDDCPLWAIRAGRPRENNHLVR